MPAYSGNGALNLESPLPDHWVSAAACARHLGVSLGTFRDWVERGVVKAQRICTRHYTDDKPRKPINRGKWYVHRDDFAAFLADYRAGRWSGR